MKYETAGDPITGLLWTRKTREKICMELFSIGINVGKTTVGKILNTMGFSLMCNSKKVSNGGKKLTKEEEITRDEQFKYIEKKRKEFLKKGLPIISVDAKNKELIGNFKNPGTRYRRLKDLVNDHDFISYAIGKAFLYGVFDVNQNNGVVYVGQSLWDKKEKKFKSSETPEFAAECIEKWWVKYGKKRYPLEKEILILADSGGSNGCRPRMWKYKLYELLSSKHNIKITVCHYPTGASKWNPIEHRLFCEISKNWRATPLINYETVLKYIKTTKTKTGLTINVHFIKKVYKKGKKLAEALFEIINLKSHTSFPKWNYSILPS